MAYHGGQKKTKTKKTKQKKGQKKSNVQTTVKNVGGKFQAQAPTQTVEETREEQAREEGSIPSVHLVALFLFVPYYPLF